MSEELKKSAKAWYISCSPRSPEKIAPELRLVSEAEGLIWDGVYTKNQHKKLGLSDDSFSTKKQEFTELKSKSQGMIATKLAQLEGFKGETFEQEVNFSVRDRVAPMKTYGFVYTDSQNKLIITPAGKMIINDKRPKEVFLKQLLKWQYPSYQHGTARPHPGKYPPSQFNIFPFVATLDLIFSLDGLTKYELAIFALTTRKFKELTSVKEEIKKFREELKKVSGKNPRKEFIYNYHYSRFKNIYEIEITIGKKIREGKTGDGLRKYIDTKIRNSNDIADAATRYFRYSGLLSSKGNRVIILKDRENDVKEILDREYKVFPYDDVDKFNENYGNHKEPRLSYENKETLRKRINELNEASIAVLDEIKCINPETHRGILSISNIKSDDVEILKDIYYDLIQNLTLLNRDALVLKLQDPKVIQEEIIPDLEIYLKSNTEINDEIADRFLVDKNSVFEYVIWRAMISLGNAIEYKNNFTIDEELNVVRHAAGNQGDIEVYYEEFTLLVEVTTSGGVAQFNMEKEPVTRHYDNLRKESKVPTYCLFIAKKINENTYKEFLRYNQIRKAKIIPLELNEYIKIINKQKDLLSNGEKITAQDLLKLFNNLLSNTITSIEEWKEKITKELDKYVTN